eukprot:10038895-Alexandrium_andersonii.AAC.1
MADDAAPSEAGARPRGLHGDGDCTSDEERPRAEPAEAGEASEAPDDLEAHSAGEEEPARGPETLETPD